VRINCLGVQHHVGRYSEEHQAARIYDKVSYLLYGNDAITNFGVAAAAADPIPIPPAMLQLKARYDSVSTKQHKTGPATAAPMQFANRAAWGGSNTSGSSISNISANSSITSSTNSGSSYGPLNVISSSSSMGMPDTGKPLVVASVQGQQQLTEVLLQPGDLAALRQEVQLAQGASSPPHAADLQWQHGNARLVPVTTGFFLTKTTSGLNLDIAASSTALHQVAALSARLQQGVTSGREQQDGGEWQAVYATGIATQGNSLVSMPQGTIATPEMLDTQSAAAQHLTAQFSAMGLGVAKSSGAGGQGGRMSLEGKQAGARMQLMPTTTAGHDLVAQQQIGSSDSSRQQVLLGASAVEGGLVDQGAVQAATVCGAGTGGTGNVKAVYDYCIAKLTRQELLALASQLSNALLR